MFHPNGPTLRELAVQALSSTERGYDLLAPKFDHTPFRTPAEVLDAVAAALADAGPLQRGLDLCCGTGAGVQMLLPLCAELVVGLDFSRGMLEAGRRRLAARGGPHRPVWVRANVLDLPFGADFDVVTCFGACGHILERDQPRFVARVAGVLRPGGRFVTVTSYPPPAGSLRWWAAHGFNAAMHVRNRLVSPPFVMYYLTFLLPQAQRWLEREGLEVQVRDLALAGPAAHLRLVSAVRPR